MDPTNDQSDDDLTEESSDEDDEEEHRPAPKAKAKRAVNGAKKAKTTAPAPKRQKKQITAATNGDAGPAEGQGQTFKTDSSFFSECLLFLHFPSFLVVSLVMYVWNAADTQMHYSLPISLLLPSSKTGSRTTNRPLTMKYLRKLLFTN
jgi:hypothetical protein